MFVGDARHCAFTCAIFAGFAIALAGARSLHDPSGYGLHKHGPNKRSRLRVQRFSEHYVPPMSNHSHHSHHSKAGSTVSFEGGSKHPTFHSADGLVSVTAHCIERLDDKSHLGRSTPRRHGKHHHGRHQPPHHKHNNRHHRQHLNLTGVPEKVIYASLCLSIKVSFEPFSKLASAGVTIGISGESTHSEGKLTLKATIRVGVEGTVLFVFSGSIGLSGSIEATISMDTDTYGNIKNRFIGIGEAFQQWIASLIREKFADLAEYFLDEQANLNMAKAITSDMDQDTYYSAVRAAILKGMQGRVALLHDTDAEDCAHSSLEGETHTSNAEAYTAACEKVFKELFGDPETNVPPSVPQPIEGLIEAGNKRRRALALKEEPELSEREQEILDQGDKEWNEYKRKLEEYAKPIQDEERQGFQSFQKFIMRWTRKMRWQGNDKEYDGTDVMTIVRGSYEFATYTFASTYAKYGYLSSHAPHGDAELSETFVKDCYRDDPYLLCQKFQDEVKEKLGPNGYKGRPYPTDWIKGDTETKCGEPEEKDLTYVKAEIAFNTYVYMVGNIFKYAFFSNGATVRKTNFLSECHKVKDDDEEAGTYFLRKLCLFMKYGAFVPDDLPRRQFEGHLYQWWDLLHNYHDMLVAMLPEMFGMRDDNGIICKNQDYNKIYLLKQIVKIAGKNFYNGEAPAVRYDYSTNSQGTMKMTLSTDEAYEAVDELVDEFEFENMIFHSMIEEIAMGLNKQSYDVAAGAFIEEDDNQRSNCKTNTLLQIAIGGAFDVGVGVLGAQNLCQASSISFDVGYYFTWTANDECELTGMAKGHAVKRLAFTTPLGGHYSVAYTWYHNRRVLTSSFRATTDWTEEKFDAEIGKIEGSVASFVPESSIKDLAKNIGTENSLNAIGRHLKGAFPPQEELSLVGSMIDSFGSAFDVAWSAALKVLDTVVSKFIPISFTVQAGYDIQLEIFQAPSINSGRPVYKGNEAARSGAPLAHVLTKVLALLHALTHAQPLYT